MTKRQLALAVTLTLAIGTAVGGLVYSLTRGPAPDDTGAKADDTPPAPASVTKATTPTRQLNEKERMLVGFWKFEKATPEFAGQDYEATFEYRPDGTFVFRSRRNAKAKSYSIRGSYQLAGSVINLRNDDGNSSALEIELTEDRFVVSHPDGEHRHVEEWSRVW